MSHYIHWAFPSESQCHVKYIGLFFLYASVMVMPSFLLIVFIDWLYHYLGHITAHCHDCVYMAMCCNMYVFLMDHYLGHITAHCHDCVYMALSFPFKGISPNCLDLIMLLSFMNAALCSFISFMEAIYFHMFL